MRNQPAHRDQKAPRQPTHAVKLAIQNGERTTFERIGAAWKRDDGSIYVKLHGTQIVSDGFSIYPIENDQ